MKSRPGASTRSSGAVPRRQIVARVAASMLGGYGFVLGFVSLGITLGVTLGMPYGEARTLLHLLAALVFLGCFLWAFVDRSIARVWIVLAGGGAVMAAVARWLAGASA